MSTWPYFSLSIKADVVDAAIACKEYNLQVLGVNRLNDFESVAIVRAASASKLNTWFCNDNASAQLMFWTPITGDEQVKAAIEKGRELAQKFVW